MHKIMILGTCLLLAACGWRPLYGDSNRNIDNLNQIWIDTIPNKDGIKLRNILMDMFYLDGSPAEPLYVLQVGLSDQTRSLGIKKDDTATRAQMYISASYTLYDRETMKPLHSGAAYTINSYNILDNQFTTTVSRDKSYESGLNNLAEKIRMNLGLYFDELQIKE